MSESVKQHTEPKLWTEKERPDALTRADLNERISLFRSGCLSEDELEERLERYRSKTRRLRVSISDPDFALDKAALQNLIIEALTDYTLKMASDRPPFGLVVPKQGQIVIVSEEQLVDLEQLQVMAHYTLAHNLDELADRLRKEDTIEGRNFRYFEDLMRIINPAQPLMSISGEEGIRTAITTMGNLAKVTVETIEASKDADIERCTETTRSSFGFLFRLARVSDDSKFWLVARTLIPYGSNLGPYGYGSFTPDEFEYSEAGRCPHVREKARVMQGMRKKPRDGEFHPGCPAGIAVTETGNNDKIAKTSIYRLWQWYCNAAEVVYSKMLARRKAETK